MNRFKKEVQEADEKVTITLFRFELRKLSLRYGSVSLDLSKLRTQLHFSNFT